MSKNINPKDYVKNAILSGKKDFIVKVLNRYWEYRKQTPQVRAAQAIFGVK